MNLPLETLNFLIEEFKKDEKKCNFLKQKKYEKLIDYIPNFKI